MPVRFSFIDLNVPVLNCQTDRQQTRITSKMREIQYLHINILQNSGKVDVGRRLTFVNKSGTDKTVVLVLAL